MADQTTHTTHTLYPIPLIPVHGQSRSAERCTLRFSWRTVEIGQLSHSPCTLRHISHARL